MSLVFPGACQRVLTLRRPLKLTSQEKVGLSGIDIMPQMGGGGAAPAAAAAPAAEEKVEKEFFDVKLVSFDPASKIKVIKEVRAITGLGLKEVRSALAVFMLRAPLSSSSLSRYLLTGQGPG